jgi:hypothetical protein
VSEAAVAIAPQIDQETSRSPRPDLRLVELASSEGSDIASEDRESKSTRPELIAAEMAASTFAERLWAYRHAYSRRQLNAAASRFPELMPVLNGEWEWIALTMADFD